VIAQVVQVGAQQHLGDAQRALAGWDGTGEPSGWHRHPSSGRRRNAAGEEYVWR